jgi:hypothetical protein
LIAAKWVTVTTKTASRRCPGLTFRYRAGQSSAAVTIAQRLALGRGALTVTVRGQSSSGKLGRPAVVKVRR